MEMTIDQRETVRQLVARILDSNNDTKGFTDTESLIFSGRFQSLDVLDVVVFLEEHFGLDFSEGFDEARLDSVEEILSLLQDGAR